MARQFLAVGSLCAAAVVLIVAAIVTTSSPVETLEDYGAYSTEIPSNNPSSLGFSPSSYLNSPRPIYVAGARRMSVRDQEKNLEKDDENAMLSQEQHQADIATVAIRKDIEEAKLQALRRRQQAKSDGYYDPSHPSSAAARQHRTDSGSMYNPAAVRKAWLKRQAMLRAQTQKELDRTFLQLSQAVGSPPYRPKQMRMQSSESRLFDNDDDEGVTKSMLSDVDDGPTTKNAASDVDDATPASSNAVSDVDDALSTGNDNQEEAEEESSPESSNNSSNNKHMIDTDEQEDKADSAASALPNDEDVHEMAQDDVGNELGSDAASQQESFGDNTFYSPPQQASLRQMRNGEELAQAHSFNNEKETERAQSLAAVAKELGGEADDVTSQWQSFTQKLGMKPPTPQVSGRAQERVANLINDDLV